MLMDEYFSAMKNVLTKAENTQRETILAAAMKLRIAWKKAAHGILWTPGIC